MAATSTAQDHHRQPQVVYADGRRRRAV